MKLSKDRYLLIQKTIIKKLTQHNIWGAKHTSIDELQKGFPKDLRVFAKEAAQGLIKEGLLLSHPTSYGLQVSLNPEKAQEIKRMLGV